MKRFSPYLIRHIDVGKGVFVPPTDTASQGTYLVFWWRDIPLGQLLIDPGDVLPENVYLKKLIAAISPSINFYAGTQKDIANRNWQQLLKEASVKEFLEWMENLFSKILQDTLPATVPVSAIICTRNRPAHLRQCLQQLHHLKCRPVEIIVVDNAPSDNSSCDVVHQFKDVKYIKEPRPGLDIARNTGILNSSSPIVAFVDDDVEVHPLWVYQVYLTFQDQKVAAMTGLVIAAKLSTEAQWMFEKSWSFNRGYQDKIYGNNYITNTLQKGPPVWEIGAGANMAFRKSVFAKVGLFDELLDVGAAGCSGDSEMWYRILINGFEIIYTPRAVVYHTHREEMSGLKKQIFSYMRGHTVAALLQQQQHTRAGYNSYVFKRLPFLYSRSTLRALLRRFPYYNSPPSTLWNEINGYLSGLIFYYKNRNKTTRHVGKG